MNPIQQIPSLAADKYDRGFRSLGANGQSEKPACAITSDLSKTEATSKPQSLALDPKAAYLISGGLGGLGTALMTWLVEHGARTIIVVSRSAGKTDESEKLVAEMESLGCAIIPVSGKVHVQEDVEMAIAKAARPIKGVVHMAMVLRVSGARGNHQSSIN